MQVAVIVGGVWLYQRAQTVNSSISSTTASNKQDIESTHVDRAINTMHRDDTEGVHPGNVHREYLKRKQREAKMSLGVKMVNGSAAHSSARYPPAH